MPKATVDTPSGAKVTIEGTSEEVIALVARLEGLDRRGNLSHSGTRTGSSGKVKPPTLPLLISEMISNGFFSEPKPLGELKEALEQNGQFYPVTTLSPAMLRLVRSRQLRRIKDGRGRWSYVR
jgi:hypothetical protein